MRLCRLDYVSRRIGADATCYSFCTMSPIVDVMTTCIGGEMSYQNESNSENQHAAHMFASLSLYSRMASPDHVHIQMYTNVHIYREKERESDVYKYIYRKMSIYLHVQLQFYITE